MDQDPFRYLEEDTEATQSWVAEQNARTKFILEALPGWKAVRQWAKAARNLECRWVPTARPNGLFFLRRTAGQPFPKLMLDGEELHTIVDPDDYGPPGRSYLTAFQASPDGHLLAFQVCRNGAETGDLYLLDLRTGAPAKVWASDLRGPIIAWHGAGVYVYRQGPSAGLWYLPIEGEPVRVWTVQDEAGPLFVAPSVSPDGKWLMLSLRRGADVRNEIWLGRIDSADPSLLDITRWQPPSNAAVIARFGPDNRIYLSGESAVDAGALAVVDPAERDVRQLLLSGQDGTEVSSFAVGRDWVAVLRKSSEGQEVLAIPTGRQAQVRRLELPHTHAVVANLTADPQSSRIWLEYSSFATPRQVMTVDLAQTTRADVWFRPATALPIPDIGQWRETYRSADGTEVDITIIARSDQERAARPTLLLVYGGFGRVISAAFRTQTLLWTMAGGVFAIAHIRGGGEKGSTWHAAGRGENKPLAVADTIAAAEYLRATKWAGKIGVIGNSNGGLIASAAATMRPEVFAACVVYAPVTDLLRFTEFGDGTAWLAEYGDPRLEPDRSRLRSYSPYHQAQSPRDYPAFLVLTGNADDRVAPAHSRKLSAALQASTRSGQLVLFFEEPHVGHGPRARGSANNATANRLSFLASQLGLSLEALADQPTD